jgi:hypothetical protein
MARGYYEPLGGGRFLATEHTVGPWSAQAQHLGPPAALLARAMQRCTPRQDTALTKITVDILGPVPRGEVEVSAAVLRPGRTVEQVGAQLAVAGTVVARATGWRLAVTDTAAVAGGAPGPMPPPTAGVSRPLPASWVVDGYLSSIEWRWLAGGWSEPGPAAAWARPLLELVSGEPTDGLCRLLTVADSASGLSARLDAAQWYFPNTDLSVHLHRSPAGEWVGVQANTAIGPTGAGVATATLHDLDGSVGCSSQILTVRARDAAGHRRAEPATRT